MPPQQYAVALSRTCALPWTVATAFVALNVIGCDDAADRRIAEIGTRPFQIAVIGDGVPMGRQPSQRQVSLNSSQGQAMYEGIVAAFRASDRSIKLRDIAELARYDDGSSERDAAHFARQIAADPSVLAVIGHASSGTTRAAAWIYEAAGIPLLMPIATSAGAMLAPGDDRRLANVFRLPPPDAPVQVGALTFVALNDLSGRQIFLIRDASPNASEYSNTLHAGLHASLSQWITTTPGEIARQHPNMSGVAEAIYRVRPDLVIFSGYGSTAKEFLPILESRFAQDPAARRPSILMSDGARVSDLDPLGFQVYLTFPAGNIAACQPVSGPDYEVLRRSMISKAGHESFQQYGYDAVLMLADAVNACTSHGINRQCVMRELAALTDFAGVCHAYALESGEDRHAEYFLYRVKRAPKSITEFELVRPITHSEIVRASRGFR